MADAQTKKRALNTFDFSNSGKANLRRLKKIYGTKKNAVETALALLNQNHAEQKARTA
jgi:hypothetical protein